MSNFELSPEEKQRIYLEEKARIEAEEQAKKELEIEQLARKRKADSNVFKIGCLIPIALVFLSAVVNAIVSPHPSEPVKPIQQYKINKEELDQKAYTGPYLIYKNFSWVYDPDTGYVTSEGRVTNASGITLKNVQALISFYDKKGNFITSDEALIEYDPLLSNQASPFKMVTRWNPAMSTASLEFKTILGEAISSEQR